MVGFRLGLQQGHGAGGSSACLSEAGIGKQLVVRVRPLTPLGIPLLEMRHLDPQNGGLDGIQPAVGPNLLVVVPSSATMVAQHDHPFRQFWIIGCERSGIAKRAEVLGGIETERRGRCHRSRFVPSPGRAHRLGRIFDDDQLVLGSKTAEGRHVRALAVKVDWQNGPPAGRRAFEFPFDQGRVEIESLWIDVHKYRARPRANNAAGSGKEAKGGGDYLISGSYACGSQGQPQGIGARGASHSPARITQTRKFPLKCRYFFAQNVVLGIAYTGYGS